MNRRHELQNLLETLLGSKNVYYQTPEPIKMKYPAIIYSRKRSDTKYANNKKYIKRNCYEIIVISKIPDDPVIEKIENLPMCELDSSYKSDNLNHNVLILYY